MAHPHQPDQPGPQWREVLTFIQTQTANDWARFERLFKYTAGAIALITAFGGGALVYFVGHSLSESREEMRRVTTAEVDNMRAEVRKRIESEFQTPQIREVVSEVARERAGQELNNIVREEVSRQVALAVKQQEGTIREEVSNETRRAVQALSPTIQSIVSAKVGTQVAEAIQPLNTALATSRDVLHSASLATTAMAGSRAAHQELRSLITSKDPDIRQIATWALEAIDDEVLDGLRSPTFISEPGMQLLQLSTSQSPTMREQSVKQMGTIKDRQYIPRIIEIIKSDPNIRVLRAALIAFTQETGVVTTFDEGGAAIALQWWEQHKSEFKQ